MTTASFSELLLRAITDPGLPGVEECRGYIQHWHGTTEPISDRCAARILRAADQILKAGAPVEVP